MNQNTLEVCFTQLKPEANRKYYESRKNAPDKHFTMVNHLTVTNDMPSIYLTTFDCYDTLLPVARELSAIEGLTSVLYKDTYSDAWLIEAFSSKASKPSGAKWIQKRMGAKHMVAFGDNLNDLPLFAAADESYAVSNAHERILAAATGVIGSNTENAVAHFCRKTPLFMNKKLKMVKDCLQSHESYWIFELVIVYLLHVS